MENNGFVLPMAHRPKKVELRSRGTGIGGSDKIRKFNAEAEKGLCRLDVAKPGFSRQDVMGS